MIAASEIRRWLNTLHPAAEVAIDDGGLNLVEIPRDENSRLDAAYLEVGGTPEEE